MKLQKVFLPELYTNAHLKLGAEGGGREEERKCLDWVNLPEEQFSEELEAVPGSWAGACWPGLDHAQEHVPGWTVLGL